MQAFLIRESRGTALCNGCGKKIGSKEKVKEYAVHLHTIETDSDALNRVHARQTVLCESCTHTAAHGFSSLHKRIKRNRMNGTTRAQEIERSEREMNHGYSPSFDDKPPEGWPGVRSEP